MKAWQLEISLSPAVVVALVLVVVAARPIVEAVAAAVAVLLRTNNNTVDIVDTVDSPPALHKAHPPQEKKMLQWQSQTWR